MYENLKGRSLLSISDLSREELYRIFDLAELLKRQQKEGQTHHLLAGKTLGMIFEKPSTRTRVSFEVGMYQLGGLALYLSRNDLQLGRGETIADTARTLGRFVDMIMARVYSHDTVEELAKYSGLPVINGLSDMEHPCQVIGDLFTIKEKKGELEGLKLCFIGDGNNVCNSLLLGCGMTGINMSVAHPPGYAPMSSILDRARKIGDENNAEISIVERPVDAIAGADIIYTDVWVSMGQEEESEEKERKFSKYKVNSELLSLAKPDTIVMHCLPAHRGEEITDEVMDGPQSVVFDQAENRLHTQKAIMALLGS
ncbi:MAG: ornithine carbamoyltransferase [Candidatus Eremiobacteraeota bacterium]|nr:ornithine carbamoyltransferase [Candidatus Eremiobacteraeota bacterium]